MCEYSIAVIILHRCQPSNKFLLYDHSLRIPMVIMGPGIQPNSANEFLGFVFSPFTLRECDGAGFVRPELGLDVGMT